MRWNKQRRVAFQAGGESLTAVHTGCGEPRGSDRRGEFGIYDQAGEEVTVFEISLTYGDPGDPAAYTDAEIAAIAESVIEEQR